MHNTTVLTIKPTPPKFEVSATCDHLAISQLKSQNEDGKQTLNISSLHVIIYHFQVVDREMGFSRYKTYVI